MNTNKFDISFIIETIINIRKSPTHPHLVVNNH